MTLAEARAPSQEEEDEGGLRFHVDLPAPLSDAGDLLRPLKARLERTELLAPAVGLTLVASGIVQARRVQLDLSRDGGRLWQLLPQRHQAHRPHRHDHPPHRV